MMKIRKVILKSVNVKNTKIVLKVIKMKMKVVFAVSQVIMNLLRVAIKVQSQNLIKDGTVRLAVNMKVRPVRLKIKKKKKLSQRKKGQVIVILIIKWPKMKLVKSDKS